ncbi:MAG: alanine--tRNA ligase [SAR202 cluster bacterium]|nr:alanine--tRNA ligase [SAR202 cluster bacterium]|tara:strand:+ start:4242 stop:6881 length:2640 start_codon:yes stop_codon:yes gene_type:complete
MRTSEEIRELFLSFFEGKGHQRIKSSSLVPHGDPTLMFTTAGMVQMKPYFLGEMPAPHPRLTSSQKSFRTTDIDTVGDLTHHTFFEMLGNFSVGDYFKEDAIKFAWEFCTEHLNLDREHIWITIFTDDDEAYAHWREIGIPDEKILRFGEEENWWGPAGDSGPCGPDSELHYDLGIEKGCGEPTCDPSCDCGRFLEIWNLVFMQYNQDQQGNRTLLEYPNIDTGMGLERIVTILQEVSTSYETDLFSPLFQHIEKITSFHYGDDDKIDWAMRVLADHGRAITFLIADGVVPGNEGRGYVLRRLIRRAVRYGQQLNLQDPFLGTLTDVIVAQMKELYPEISENTDFIKETVLQEEERFNETLSIGLMLFEEVLADEEIRESGIIPGSQIFRLYDTYGFPIDVAREVAQDEGLTLDEVGFETELENQRERARSAQSNTEGIPFDSYSQLASLNSQFVGYENLTETSYITGLITGGSVTEKASQGQEVEVIVPITPFYPEGGGQVGDSGYIFHEEQNVIRIRDTRRPLRTNPDFIVHQGIVEEGSFQIGDHVVLEVNAERRSQSARNHTATHILHATLRNVLGSHVQQAGSLVAPDHLRFDFSHNLALNTEEFHQVKNIVNARVRQNIEVRWQSLPLRQALNEGALAFFGDKYEDPVRMVSIIDDSPFSLELCGGTHVSATGEVGYIHISSEGSIGSGMRRIEAVTGDASDNLIARRLDTITALAKSLQTSPDELENRIEAINQELNQLRTQAHDLELKLAYSEIEKMLGNKKMAGDVPFIAARATTTDASILREMADILRERLGSGIVLLAAVDENRPRFIAAVTSDLVGKGYHAGRLVKSVAEIVGGGGGGQAEMAQAGGRDISKLDDALESVTKLIKPE